MAAKVKYNPDYHDNWAWSLAAMGATNEEIAKAMGVSKRTIIRWSQDHESFGSALAQGKGVSDAKVIRSLYQRAVGYEYEEEKKIIEYDKDGNVKPIKIEKTKKQVPPDVGAQCFWEGRLMGKIIRIGPQKGPQERFLATSADICIYGGAAGGGKTFGLLLEPIRHMNNKNYNAVIFRSNYTQVTSPGGLWDSSGKIYSLVKAPKLHWTFKSGATVNFAHLGSDSDCQNWQGSQIAMIGFDELTHFSKHQFFYMLSRNRTDSGVAPYVRATLMPIAG